MKQRRRDGDDVAAKAAAGKEELREDPEGQKIAQKPAVKDDAGLGKALDERDRFPARIQIRRVGDRAEQLCAAQKSQKRSDHQKKLPYPVLIAADAKEQRHAEHGKDADRRHDRVGSHVIPKKLCKRVHANIIAAFRSLGKRKTDRNIQPNSGGKALTVRKVFCYNTNW